MPSSSADLTLVVVLERSLALDVCVCVCVSVDQHTPWRVCVVGPLDFGFNLLIYGLPLRQKAQLLAKAHYDISTTPCHP